MDLIFKKGNYLFLLIMLLSVQLVWSQKEVLSLEQCQKEVQQNYPLVKGKDLILQTSKLNVDNIEVSYLPRLFANGKLSYQSDVTGLSIPGIDSPKPPKDQYSLNLDVEQLLYNGGKTKNQILVEKKSSEVEIKNLEIQMYQLRERVNIAYFKILLLRKSRSVLLEKKNVIAARIKQVASSVENGVVLAANQKVLESELLLVDQQLNELDASEESAFLVLSELMGRRLNREVNLEELGIDEDITEYSNLTQKKRPEYQWYGSQKSLLEAKEQLVKKDRYPVVTGFGQFGYGNPGYKQLVDKFDSYYMLGAKISWNIFDWKYTHRKQKEILLQKDLIETRELSFTQNQLIEIGTEVSNTRKIKLLLKKDDAIIELQEQVSRSSASQLDNGVITSSDYLEDLNKEIQAKLNKEYHLIQLQQSLAEYKRIVGI